MRCPDCNKFVSIEMAEPELELELGEGEVTGTVRLVQTCADCGTELAEANPDIYEPFDFEHKSDDCDGKLILEDESAENDDKYEGKGRYAKHFYSANITATIRCEKCGAEMPFETSVEEQASFFEPLA